MPCQISFEAWADYVDGRLTPTRQAELQAHLDTQCPDCTASVTWLNRIVPRMRAAGQTPVPLRALLDRANRIFPDPAPSPSLRARFWASLRFDSQQAALMGVRSTPPSERQLLYQADNIDIDLHIHAVTGNSISLTGQIMPGSERLAQVDGARVTLQTADRLVRESAADDLGEFALTDFDPGRYTLTIALTDCEIFVEDLELA